MSTPLTPDDVRKVARLARLKLTDDEVAAFTRQLADVVRYVDQLSEVNTAGVEPLAHPLPVQNVFREDEPRPSLPVAAALANAPVRLGDYFGVPAVFDTDG